MRDARAEFLFCLFELLLFDALVVVAVLASLMTTTNTASLPEIWFVTNNLPLCLRCIFGCFYLCCRAIDQRLNLIFIERDAFWAARGMPS